MKQVTFKEALEYLDNGWFPIWAAYPDSTAHNDECLTIDWVCTHRIPDGKYFSTESVVTDEQAEEFKKLALKAWQEEMQEADKRLTKKD